MKETPDFFDGTLYGAGYLLAYLRQMTRVQRGILFYLKLRCCDDPVNRSREHAVGRGFTEEEIRLLPNCLQL